jgi:nickel-dependent lactate racemase
VSGRLLTINVKKMIYYQKGSIKESLSTTDIEEALVAVLEHYDTGGKVLALPPDFTRYHSFAGTVMQIADRYLGDRLTDILPATGTHTPMTVREIESMFGTVNKNKFRIHDWRRDVITLGEVPAEFVSEVSEGLVNYAWPVQVNKLLAGGGHDLILSVGQVVPHEVAGMANYTKNIFVGTGGQESINKSHFLGAVFGMERMMGRSDTPVRKVLNYAAEHFASHLPIAYILTVVGSDDDGQLKLRGLYAGDDNECFELACKLSLQVNFRMLDEPLKKIVVYLDPAEYKSTWLGNKSIYRTRMAIADGGELIILAPGVATFGEDKIIDALIRKYGYITAKEVIRKVEENEDLRSNLSAAAHLIHGSSENRFRITYCTKKLSGQEITGVGFHYAGLEKMIRRYDPSRLREGMSTTPDGEDVFFIPNPALGLWACKGRY